MLASIKVIERLVVHWEALGSLEVRVIYCQVIVKSWSDHFLASDRGSGGLVGY